MRRNVTWILVMALTAVTAAAQNMDEMLAKLAEKAKSKVDLKLDPAMLKGLGAALPEQVKGIESVTIHAYEYANTGEYSADLLEPLRKRYASDSAWTKLISAHDGEDKVDIFVQMRDGKIGGLVVIAAEPKELAIIEATGVIELAQVKELVSSKINFDLASIGNLPQ